MQTAYLSRKPRLGVLIVVLALSLGSGAACITAPVKEPTAQEKARKENALGSELSSRFESKLHFRSDAAVTDYLTRIAREIATPAADPRLTETEVVVIQDRSGQWRNYSLPGRKVYLSAGLLKELQFENEVAAEIALEFGNLVQRHALKHLDAQAGQPVEFFDGNGIFNFSVQELEQSIRTAIDLLYKSGYDSRGLIQLWKVFEANPKHSPFSERVIEELIDYTRASFAQYAPLRNPIVTTDQFQTLRKRIESL